MVQEVQPHAKDQSFNSTPANGTLDPQFISVGPIMPLHWTPPNTPRERRDEPPEFTFKRAEMETKVRLPRRRVTKEECRSENKQSLCQRKVKPQKCDDKDTFKKIRRAGSDASPSPRKYGTSHKSVFSKDEKLVGLHFKRTDLKIQERGQEATKVVYSGSYLRDKGFDEEEVAERGIGKVIGWDPDGLMTDVLWEDGSTEYCCTGYNRMYHLALYFVVDKEGLQVGWEDPAKLLISTMSSYPLWEVDMSHYDDGELLEGLNRLPVLTRSSNVKDVWDEVRTQQRLRRSIKAAMKEGNKEGQRVYEKALRISRQNMEILEKEHEIMSDWIVGQINDVEIKIPPSSLAPSAPALVKMHHEHRPKLLDEIRKQVRRDTEKATRQARLEKEAEKERVHLERKAAKFIKKDPGGVMAQMLADRTAQNSKKQARLKMDPWEAVTTANGEELNEILDQTFSLFDFDLSGSLDLNEFSQAHLLVQKYKYWRIY
jgi:hypothetical protein